MLYNYLLLLDKIFDLIWISQELHLCLSGMQSSDTSVLCLNSTDSSSLRRCINTPVVNSLVVKYLFSTLQLLRGAFHHNQVIAL